MQSITPTAAILPPPNQINTIIFDLGKVVFDYDFERVFTQWQQLTGIKITYTPEFETILFKFEAGQLTPTQFKKQVALLMQLKRPIDATRFWQAWNDIYLNIYPDIDKLLTQLSKNFRMVALTNTNAVHTPYWQQKYTQALSVFEHIFCSFKLKAIKPEPVVFNTVLNYLQQPPDKVLFLDDNPKNTSGATALGLHTYLVKNANLLTQVFTTAGYIK
ncbi:MAG: HAD family phosphatase [Sphingobacteriales bacterium]|jgi:HAD superfamily hydrolase (TIGR01509 family)|nr:HAD family phosphatase [Sphingobacteriales bacterium]MBP9140524.1 HAD family phosphatase [Chitinophagales bacterium]MDA0197295.1 HAD family phosphatase [Bacteroidota bacterium]MBK6890406.1 HAD family phosphatase [Sphingobacteriales bacterium]MBK7526539.1 HAD family phosphatase [Sphingobacteriales bacterium]